MAAAAFCAATVVSVESWKSWQRWQTAQPVTVSLSALSKLTQLSWGLSGGTLESAQPSAPMVMALPEPGIKAPTASAYAPVLRKHSRPQRVSARPRLAPATQHETLRAIAGANRDRVLSLWAGLELPLSENTVTLVAQASMRADRVPSKALVNTHSRPKRVALVASRRSLQMPRTEYPGASGAVTQSSQALSQPARVDTHTLEDRLKSAQALPVAATAATVSSRPEVLKAQQGSLKLITREGGAASWIKFEGVTGPATLFTQSNIQIPHALPAARPGVTPLDTQTGWVSGWISSGSAVKVSGAHVAATYFSAEGSPVESTAPGEKFFVLSRVKPGAAVVQVQNGQGSVVMAAGVPVVAQVNTQINFRASHKATLRGELLSADSQSREPIAHAEIKVVGYPGVFAVTDAGGAFALPDLEVPVGMNLYLEARLPSGFTHRYSIAPKVAQQALQLFYLGQTRIAHWSSDLEGGMSASSGVLVSFMKQAGIDGARPAIKLLAGASDLQPETYWLGADDRLMDPTTSAIAHAPGGFQPWIGVEVPAGAVLAGLQSPRGRWISAEWFPVSPGVVGILNSNE